LLDRAATPFARLSLLTAAGYVAVSRSDYETAEEIGKRAVRLKRELGIERAWPLIQLCAAQLGLRKFDAAHRTLEEIESGAERNTTLRGQLEVLRAKFALFRTGYKQLLAEQVPTRLAGLPRSSLGEYLGLLAIGAAATGDLEAATRHAARAERISKTIEARFYPRFARVISRSVNEGEADGVRRAAVDLLFDASAAELTDAFVISYRAYPPLLRLIAKDAAAWRLAKGVARAARDERLIRGINLTRSTGRNDEHVVASLTKREMEVLELLVAGSSNAEIADSLVISHSTAKVHVHNILAKLGVRTRAQAVVLAHRALRDLASETERSQQSAHNVARPSAD
jgi:ATP/maltotriose-dependent transcriptional regulator MalT